MIRLRIVSKRLHYVINSNSFLLRHFYRSNLHLDHCDLINIISHSSSFRKFCILNTIIHCSVSELDKALWQLSSERNIYWINARCLPLTKLQFIQNCQNLEMVVLSNCGHIPEEGIRYSILSTFATTFCEAYQHNRKDTYKYCTTKLGTLEAAGITFSFDELLRFLQLRPNIFFLEISLGLSVTRENIAWIVEQYPDVSLTVKNEEAPRLHN